jgi:uncharacterized membrane protein YfcA
LLSAGILTSIFLTSVISGVLGMAGGLILMAVLISALPVASAMMLHGAVQATANGSRAVFLREHIQWRILPPYLLGASLALGAFLAIALVPHPGVVLILLGGLTWLGRAVPRVRGLNICQPRTALACGCVITSAQLLAGASGPVLDLFYLNSPLTRHQVVASKALTQALGHLIKLGYYGIVLLEVRGTDSVSAWLYVLAVGVAVIGTRIGTRLLDRVAEATFRRLSGQVILTIATVCMISGVLQLAGQLAGR